jgi:cytochrome c556
VDGAKLCSERVGKIPVLTLGLAIFATFGLAGCFDAPKDTHPGLVLTKRKSVFKQINHAFEPLLLAANGRSSFSKDAFLVQAQDLASLSTKPWAYFPADGNYPPTHAREEVWSKALEFKAAQETYLTAVNRLLVVAQTGDMEQIRPAVAAVDDGCKSCHHRFRND